MKPPLPSSSTSASAPGTSRSRRVLGWTLAGTLAATAWAAWQDDGDAVVAPESKAAHRELAVRRRNAVSPASTETVSWPAAPLPGRLLEAPIVTSAWQPAEMPPSTAPTGSAAAPASASEDEVPKAPPFAYSLIGRLNDGQPHALLSGPLRSISVMKGDVVDGQWRVDSIGMQSVTVTWLPGKTSQQLGFKPS